MVLQKLKAVSILAVPGLIELQSTSDSEFAQSLHWGNR